MIMVEERTNRNFVLDASMPEGMLGRRGGYQVIIVIGQSRSFRTEIRSISRAIQNVPLSGREDNPWEQGGR